MISGTEHPENDTQDVDLQVDGQDSNEAKTTPEEAVRKGEGDGNADDNVEQAACQSTPESTPESTLESLQEKVSGLEAELENQRDQALRARAEADNAIKRMEREADKARKFALERFANELLAVIDSTEMGLQAAQGEGATVGSLREGTELTLKMLLSALGKHGVEAVDPVEQKFDPELHEALSMAPVPDVEPNTVINVVQKGYTLNGRLLRPARVIVATAPAA